MNAYDIDLAARRRNPNIDLPDHHHRQPRPVSGLTAGGKVIWLRTGRPAPTCNVLATLAGLGGERI